MLAPSFRKHIENPTNHQAPKDDKEPERPSFSREDFAFLLRVVSGAGTEEEHEKALQMLGLDNDQEAMPIAFSDILVESMQQEVLDRVKRNKKQ